MKKSGIYQIKNIANQKIYIGSAVYIKSRWSTHKSLLRNNKHSNIHLQRAWNTTWPHLFVFSVLEYVEDKTKLIEREQFWIDKTECCNPDIGYNLCKIGRSALGKKHREETKLKISLSLIGKSKGMSGKKHSDETKLKISILLNGRVNRNKEKWPCKDGFRCKCKNCKTQRNRIAREAKHAKLKR